MAGAIVAMAGAQVIGRFLLGSGLGALVGTGLLALASVISSAQEAAVPDLAGAVVADDPGVAEVAPEVAVEASPKVATEVAAEADAPAAPQGVPQDQPVIAETAPVAPEAKPVADAASGADGAAEPVVAAAEEAAPDVMAGVPPALSPILADPPQAPDARQAGARVETGPDVPADATAPLVAPAPDAPADLAGDAVPVPAEQPAAAPAGVAAEAPTAPMPPEQDIAALTPPDAGPALSPAVPAQPGAAALAEAPVRDAAPSPAEWPGPADVPGEAPVMADEVAIVPDGAPAPEAPAETPVPEVSVEEPPSLLTEVEDERVIRTGDGGSTLPSTPSLAEAAEKGVKTDRLPRIGGGDAIEAEAEAGQAVTDTRPIAAYARTFENPEGKPAFAIVLIDQGGADLDRAALAALPFPVSFALDPTNPLAADHAAIYRGAGQEVVMLATALPKGGQAGDIEVALSAMGSALPEAVAVMDLAERVFQADRPMATLVVPVVGAGGRGLLTWDQGLNAADQVARHEGVPAAVVFRDLDGADEAGPVIRRYLDRAAFKAAQDGTVTVVGRARPETVAALLEWAVEGRAATVALAPLTAVLTVN